MGPSSVGLVELPTPGPQTLMRPGPLDPQRLGSWTPKPSWDHAPWAPGPSWDLVPFDLNSIGVKSQPPSYDSWTRSMRHPFAEPVVNPVPGLPDPHRTWYPGISRYITPRNFRWGWTRDAPCEHDAALLPHRCDVTRRPRSGKTRWAGGVTSPS